MKTKNTERIKKRRRAPSNEPMFAMSLRMPESLKDKLLVISDREQRSLNNLVVSILTEAARDVSLDRGMTP